MKRINLKDIPDIKKLLSTIDKDKTHSKWFEIIGFYFNRKIKNYYLIVILSVICEMHQNRKKSGNFLKEIRNLIATKPMCEIVDEKINLVYGEIDYLLENDKYLSYYQNTVEGAIEIALNYIECEELVTYLFPEEAVSFFREKSLSEL